MPKKSLTNMSSTDRVEEIYRRLKDFLVNIEYGEFTVKKKNDIVYMTEKKETES